MNYDLIQGDAIDVMRTLPAGSVQCCVTSPPYYGLRDYGVDGQIGLEADPETYVAKLVEVFREVRRLLHPSGTVWLNLGDSFSSGVGANVNDLLAEAIEEGVIFLGSGCSLTITAKRDGVLKHDKLTPNAKLTPLFGVKRIFIKDGDNNLRQIFDSFTSIGCNWISTSVVWAAIGQSNSDIVLDTVDDLKIVISDHDLDTNASFVIPILSCSTENGKTAFAIKEAAEPVAKSIGNGKSIGDAIAGNALSKSLTQVDAIDDSVSFGNATMTRTRRRGDLRITKASNQQFFFSLEDGRCDIAVLGVSHLFVSNRFGSFIRYTELYDQTIRKANTLQAKQELGIPDLVKRALMEDGWICRSTIIWHKRAPMPESVTDRPTKAHEQVFLLSKNASYYYDAEAIAEPAQVWTGQAATFARTGAVSDHIIPGQSAAQHRSDRTDSVTASTRNKRSVWSLGPESYQGAHFAVMPTKLVEPCILAGTSAHGCCSACKAPWERIVDKTTTFEGGSGKAGRSAADANANGKWAGQQYGENIKLGPVVHTSTLGWQPTCTCGADVIPCTVLDPFAGSGTTLAVALKYHRRAVGIDLSASYIEMAHDRIRRMQPLLLAAD